ncbi:hypothetical protein [uncultured Ruegeria sp.]|uniref:hypothetical protein n=1 Tax=uncultured Ruegeria sp. TaxID=259304 RepID=UPI00260873CF|nr:hypothetical protein [uncultured Ruegeria sp.]
MTQEQELMERCSHVASDARLAAAALEKGGDFPTGQSILKDCADMIEALQSQLAKAREVKPLRWECTDWSAGDGVKGENDCEWQAMPHIHDDGLPYEIVWNGADSFSVYTPYGQDFKASSLAEAKAAAQADYQRRYTAMSSLTQQGDG